MTTDVSVTDRFEARLRSGDDLVVGRADLVQRGLLHTEARGRLVAARRRYVVERAGESALGDIAQGLSAEASKLLLDPPLAFSWQPVRPLVEIDLAILDRLMLGSLSSMKQFGGDIARHDLPVVFKPLLRLAKPEFLVSKTHFLLQSYFRPGGVKVVELGARRATVQMQDLLVPHYLCIGIAGWMRSALQLTGSKHATVLHKACIHKGDPFCVNVITW